MTYPADPSSGYQPSGGWGYTEWGAAGAEAWGNAGDATAAGDPTTAAHWTEVAQQADANSHDIYVGGGAGYGSGGDTSGSNDGTYWGATATPETAVAPGYETTTPEAPSYEPATPSYDTGATETTPEPSAFSGSELGHDPLDSGF